MFNLSFFVQWNVYGLSCRDRHFPNRRLLVFVTLIFDPLPLLWVLKILSKVLNSLSSVIKIAVSSACCTNFILVGISGGLNRLIPLLVLIRRANPSAQIGYRRGDNEHPCLIPHFILIWEPMKLLTIIQLTELLYDNLIHWMILSGIPILVMILKR